MAYIQESCDAVKMHELVQKKLFEFRIYMEHDIVASTHDGVALMKKYSTLNDIDNQLCYNHPIHLVIMDVFYRKKDYMADNIDNFPRIADDNGESEIEFDENNNNDCDEICFNEDGNLNFGIPENNSNYCFRNDIRSSTLEECRTLFYCTLFQIFLR